MGKELDLKTKIFQSIICDIRENHPETIDKAYEYFWDGQMPDEFLSGTALSVGFINFEDWLVFDHKINEDRETFIDNYIKCNKELNEEEHVLLNRIKGSVISLYEVASVSKEKRVLLRDLLIGEEFDLRDKSLSKGLKKGDIFAARLLMLDGKYVMSGCVYPFNAAQKKAVLRYIEKQFDRYKRNVNPDGSMRDFLKDYGDVLNIIWFQMITDPQTQNSS